MKQDLFRILRDCYVYASRERSFRASHIALYLYIVNLSNRLGWKTEVGLPTDIVMDTLSISNYRSYKKLLDDLIRLKLIEIVSRSTNQHTACVVAINFAFNNASVEINRAGDKVMSIAESEQSSHNKTNKDNKKVKYQKDIIFCLNFYKDFYQTHISNHVIIGDSEEESLLSLLIKLDEYKGHIQSPSSLTVLFQEFITAVYALNNAFYRKHFTLTVLSKRFNDILNDILMKNKQKTPDDGHVYIKPKYWSEK